MLLSPTKNALNLTASFPHHYLANTRPTQEWLLGHVIRELENQRKGFILRKVELTLIFLHFVESPRKLGFGALQRKQKRTKDERQDMGRVMQHAATDKYGIYLKWVSDFHSENGVQEWVNET